jgi:tetrahedral aminopeptidase
MARGITLLEGEAVMKALIKKLVEAYGPSGREAGIREMVRAEIKPNCDYLTVDPLGNLIGVVRQKAKTGKKIMLAAHMDEIGVMVSHIDDHGFARFASIGWVNPLTSIGDRVRFADGRIGVIGMETREDEKSRPANEHLYIDVGAASRETCPVRVGDTAIFDRPLSEAGSRLIAKSMDDRIGVAILIETLRRLKRTPHEIQAVFTVQEEVGTRGAQTAAYQLGPDIGIAVDVTLTGDTPRGEKMNVALGKGPAVKVRDSGMIADPRIVEWMVERSTAARIPYQREVLEMGSTDARAIQLSRAGVATGCLSIPCRYVHSPSEMVDMGDVESAVNLLISMLQQPAPFS